MTASDVAPDGSPVALYLAIPAMGEAELIHAAVPAGATVLDVGTGVGRIARPLLDLGHPVIGIDDSAEMLAHLDPRATPVLGDAREVRLGRRVDVVLLASHILNSTDADAWLAAASAHLDPGGQLIAEVYPPDMDWSALVGQSRRIGDATIETVRADVDGSEVAAEMAYTIGDRRFRQPFRARMLDDAELRAVLEAAGFTFDRWLDRAGWFLAHRSARA